MTRDPCLSSRSTSERLFQVWLAQFVCLSSHNITFVLGIAILDYRHGMDHPTNVNVGNIQLSSEYPEARIYHQKVLVCPLPQLKLFTQHLFQTITALFYHEDRQQPPLWGWPALTKAEKTPNTMNWQYQTNFKLRLKGVLIITI